MIEYTIHLKLILDGPIHSHSTAAGHPGVDSPMSRNSDGHYSLPGSLIKGRLREAMTELREKVGTVYAPDIDDLFGQGTGNSDNNKPNTLPHRGRLHIDDFLETSVGGREEITRISLDPTLGAVRQKMLQVIEAPWSSGEKAEFRGAYSFIVKDRTAGEVIRKQVETGLRWITGFGSNRTVGFGSVHKIEIERTCVLDLVDESGLLDLADVESFDLAIRPHTPFCIAKHRVAENIFESEKIIPGNVIKGCLAEQWRGLLGHPAGRDVALFDDPTRRELMAHFDKIRFTHAFPAHESSATRPVVVPLSIVKVDRNPFDVAMRGEAVLINGEAPDFQVDWKDRSDMEEQFGWQTADSALTTELRVRTSIDSASRKAAEGQLFAYEMVVPKGFVWYSRVDLRDITDLPTRAKVIRQLQVLLRPGLRGLGKTKAKADVRILQRNLHVPPKVASDPSPRVVPPKSSAGEDLWIVTLQTPAILCNPFGLHGRSWPKDLYQLYHEIWSQLSDGSLHLCHFFASQSLAGGFYLHRRFRETQPKYYPFLLTNPGSVFVLRKEQNAAGQFIRDWLQHGLPLPDWAQQRYAPPGTPGEHWDYCPYIRQNGFGEIAVNLQHRIPEPGEGECRGVTSLVD